jgi:glycosyltransferase involved in cell wall biosynthesis
MAQYLASGLCPRAPRVLVVHEPGTRAAADHLAEATGMRRLLRTIELRASHRFERRALGLADATVVFTEPDRQDLRGVAPDAAIHVVPLGVQLPATPADPIGVEPPEVCFVGSFKHPPNVAAASVLLRDIMPRVWRRHAAARLVIVGPDPPATLRAPQDDRVHVTGEVPDVAPYLARAAVVAAPIRSGGGMRVKVLEALAAGKAVVASPRAVAGLDVRDGEHVLIRDADGPVADAISDVLDDVALRTALAAAGRDWAARHVGWPAVAARIGTVWERALADRSSRQTVARVPSAS